MRQVVAIARRETRAFVGSTQAPVIAAGFLVLTGLFYYLFVRGYADASLATVRSGRPVFLNLHAGIFHKLYGDVVLFLVFLLPAVTMRLFSSEYRSGRYDLIVSWPVSASRWVLGKWLSAVAVALILLAGTAFYFALTGLLGRFADPVVAPDWAPMLTALLGLTLLSGAITAWGLAASALIAHQAGAYFLGFVASLALFLVGQLQPYLPGGFGLVAAELSMSGHFLRFAGGVLDSRDVIYFLGLAAVGLAVAGAAVDQRRLAPGHRMRPWLTVLVVLAVAVFLQLVAMRRPLQIDVTPDRLYSLAPQTEQILASLGEGRPARTGGSDRSAVDVEIVAFYQSIDGARQSAQALLSAFADRSPHLSYRVVDPDSDPALVREHGVTVMRTVVLLCEDRRRLLLEPDEGQLAGAIFRIATDTRPVAYWLLGQGEARDDLEESGGASQLAELLTDSGYAVRPLVLSQRLRLPDDADVVVWAGPKLNPAPDVLALLTGFLGDGGAMACFFGPDTPSAVRAWTERFNVTQVDDVVVAPNRASALAGVGLRTVTVVDGYGEHPTVRHMRAVTTTFPLVQTLRSVTREMPGVRGEIILLTSSSTWSERDLATRYSGNPNFDQSEDRLGPLPFGVALQVAPTDTAAGTPDGRLVIVGSSGFVTNGNIGLYGNRDLALNIVGWLAQEEDLLGIRGRRKSFQPLLLDDSTKEWLGWIAVLAWPALVGLCWFGGVLFRQWRH